MTEVEGADGAAAGSAARPRSAYVEREERHRALRDEAAARAGRLSALRGTVFVVAFGAVVLWDALDGALAWAALAVAGALALIFFVLVARHRRARREEAWNEALRRLAHEGLYRLERRWDELETVDRRAWPLDEDDLRDHAFAADLHLFGRASLIRLCGPLTTAPGRAALVGWMLGHGEPDAVSLRQDGVRELAPELDLRLEVAALGRSSRPAWPGEVERFLGWAEDPPRLLADGRLTAAAFGLPLLTVGSAALYFGAGWLPVWIVTFVAQVLVLRRVQSRARDDFDRAAAAAAGVRRYGAQLRRIHAIEPASRVLRGVRRDLGEGREAAHVRLEALGSALDVAESRRSMFYHLLNPFLLLDVHVARRLERWKARSGGAVRGWLDALGRFEALASLASLAHDHPDWTFPVLEPGAGSEPILEAEALGHPLLPSDACVRNDVEVGPPGTFLLVTGSNMSGKSTLLRALGANVVLAYAGAPVCATSFRLPAVRLHTSMFVEDSLEEGVSRFMAELLRVRDIVLAARAPGPPVLYLLDEILQGTNTAERRVAARAVIRHLLDEGAIGGVTTHDLTLHEAPDLEARAVMRHFREEVARGGAAGARPRLTFDYRLRPGLATTRNALRLLEAVGLEVGGVPEEGEEGGAGGARP